ncbi:MAG: nitrogenase reductase, partial [Deltaproteobacteria bacterium]|nr:nitrogenase reductase [Deltaproteobacteria bacterium]
FYLDETAVMTSGAYDVAVFDVLGDVVCGGFAAPLRDGFAEKVVIVVSEQPMALFAANNICRAVVSYRRNGVVLAGLVLNHATGGPGDEVVRRFAERVGTRVLASVGREPAIMDGERRQLTVIEHAPESAAALALAGLADAILAVRPAEVPAPEPMSDNDFFAFLRDSGG